jgi:hypothetical protein
MAGNRGAPCKSIFTIFERSIEQQKGGEKDTWTLYGCIIDTEKTHRRKDKCLDRQTNIWTDRLSDRQIDRHAKRLTFGWTDRQLNRWMVRQTDRQTDEKTDVLVD